MNPVSVVILFGLCIGVALCEPIYKFKACGSPHGHINSLDVNPCGGSTCKLPSGTVATIKLNFTSNVHTKQVKAVVHGYVIGIPIPFPLPEPHGCNSGINCPIKPGQTNLYENTLPINKIYPKIGVKVKWELKDDKGKNLACFMLPIRITK